MKWVNNLHQYFRTQNEYFLLLIDSLEFNVISLAGADFIQQPENRKLNVS